MSNTKATERPVYSDCSYCGCQHGTERVRKNLRPRTFRWCQDCGEESE